jgi:hypothetical protein
MPENVLNTPRKGRKMHRKKDSTWQRNAASQIVLDSIFAALAGIWITVALPDHSMPTRIRFIEVLCSVLSFFCFAVSAEGTTTAYDEWDVLKYVYYLFWYNVGVVLLGIAIAALIFAHFECNVLTFMGDKVTRLPPRSVANLVQWGYVAVFALFLLHWFRDAWWILFKNTVDFNNYLNELNDDETPPSLDRHRFMKLLFRRRIKNEPSTT